MSRTLESSDHRRFSKEKTPPPMMSFLAASAQQ